MKRTTFLQWSVCIAATAIMSCNSSTTSKTDSTTDSTNVSTTVDSSSPKTTKISGPAPSWAPDMKPEMAAVIAKLGSYGDSPIAKLSAVDARKNHSPADAVMDLMKENNITPPNPMSDTTGKEIPVGGGTIHIRIYTPKTGAGPFPVIVYYHGGGWVIANLDTYDASARSLADQTGSVLVSVAYRQAPEFKFPKAHEDSYGAYEWVVNNIVSLKGDPKKIAVVGESAGGNLACNVSIMARDKGMQLPVYQVLVYPIAGYDFTTPSYKKQTA